MLLEQYSSSIISKIPTEKAPVLKLMRECPLVVVPSGKMRRWRQSVPLLTDLQTRALIFSRMAFRSPWSLRSTKRTWKWNEIHQGEVVHAVKTQEVVKLIGRKNEARLIGKTSLHCIKNCYSKIPKNERSFFPWLTLPRVSIVTVTRC